MAEASSGTSAGSGTAGSGTAGGDEGAGAPRLLLRDVELDGRRADVACAGGRVVQIDPPSARRGGDVVVDGAGGALLPGLHDHHLHLLSAAAALDSVDASGPAVLDAAGLQAALRAAGRPGQWVRVVGYHESIAGPLDRSVLDALMRDRPVRVQHRSGALWVLNSAALRAAGLEAQGAAGATRAPTGHGPAGVERDAAGRPTGRLWRLDAWLRDRIPSRPPDLGAIGRRLAGRGVTAVTDATPTDDPAALALIAEARATGALPQRVVIMGGVDLPADRRPEVPRGPVKLVVPDHDPPPLPELADQLRVARARRGPVAVHVVTLESLVLVLRAMRTVGPVPGDRIEHAAVVIPALLDDLAGLHATVVTSPGMIRDRGDSYLEEVDAAELPHLWPCRSLLDAGIPVGAGSDAPFGPLDPWVAMDAARRRTARSGRPVGEHQRIPARRALDLFLGPLGAPGGPPRRVATGCVADLCLLDRPLDAALVEPLAVQVAATIVAGSLVT